MLVGIYCRVSTLDQSTELQRNELEAFVKARGWNIFKVYEEKISGTTDNRPQFKEMLSDAKQRKFNIVICWKLDRISRSLKALIMTLQEFSELGIQFISLKDNLDFTTSTGRLMTHIIGAFAEFEANIIKERVNAGILAAKNKGKIFGKPPTINKVSVAELRGQGLSLSAIAKKVGATKSGVSKVLSKLKLQHIEITNSEKLI